MPLASGTRLGPSEIGSGIYPFLFFFSSSFFFFFFF